MKIYIVVTDIVNDVTYSRKSVINKILSLWLCSVAAQPSLCLARSETPKMNIVYTILIDFQHILLYSVHADYGEFTYLLLRIFVCIVTILFLDSIAINYLICFDLI